MRLKPILERVIFYGLLAASVNYFGLPISDYVNLSRLKKNVENNKIQEVCKTDDYLEEIISNIDAENCNALQLLEVSQALSSKYLISDKLLTSHKKELNKALKEGKADCTYFSLFTYSNFLYLADKFDRPDLKDKVRFAEGAVLSSNNKLIGLHDWLQVYHENQWKNYESFIDYLDKESDINFKDLAKKEPFIFDSANYHNNAYFQFENGRFKSYTNLSGSIESGVDYKDALGYLIKEIFRN